jgi:predicted RNA-binding Zn-ribbon protein involved in translation (DUF1610 family)
MTKRFPAFSPSDLQTVRAFLRSITNNNSDMSASDVVAVIDDLLGRSGLWPSQEHVKKPIDISGGFTCPACGKGIISRWPNVSAQTGANVYGCTRCMWSEMR